MGGDPSDDYYALLGIDADTDRARLRVADGAMLAPSVLLRGMTRPVRFRMRVRAKAQA
jgi:hypothetical protein